MADYGTLLREHATLTCRSVDRIFLQAYVPRSQSAGGVCLLLRWQRGCQIPSSAAFGKIGNGYVAEIQRWAKANGVPVRRFAKGENKEAIARPLLEPRNARAAPGRWCWSGSRRRRPRYGGRGRPKSTHSYQLSARCPLARAWRCLDRSLDEFINDALAAA